MKLDINKIEFKSTTDNIQLITHDGAMLRFWSPKILAPFGIDNEYGKQLLKLELDESVMEIAYFKKLMIYIESMIKKKLIINDNEFKSVIKKREKKDDMMECRLKTMKNNILTEIEYEDKDNHYLKTIYDMPKQSYIKAQIEINGIWDYRTEKQESNKCGLIVNIKKIIVLK